MPIQARLVRRLFAWSIVALLVAGTALAASATPNDATADRVLGQPDFVSNTSDNPVLAGDARLDTPRGVTVVQSNGRLYVADSGNHRILSWASASSFSNGQIADTVLISDGITLTLDTPSHMVVDGLGNLFVADTNRNRILKFAPPIISGTTAASIVLGQPSFNDDQINNPSPGARTLNSPFGLAVDSNNNLYVADTDNNRVLRYAAPINTTYVSATLVIGQSSFTGIAPNGGGSASASTLNHPRGVAIDKQGNLYVSDTQNNRILRYAAPLTNGMSATRVIGQPDFATVAGGTSATKLIFPYGLALDRYDNVYIADVTNNRVIMFTAPITNGMAAFRVFGQPNFTSSIANNGGISASSLNFPYGVAVDASDHLYIVENSNNRVLGYDRPTPHYFMPFIAR